MATLRDVQQHGGTRLYMGIALKTVAGSRGRNRIATHRHPVAGRPHPVAGRAGRRPPSDFGRAVTRSRSQQVSQQDAAAG